MNRESLEKLRYPIGKFDWNDERSPDVLEKAIVEIKTFPSKLSETVSALPTKTMQHRYRPNGWTIAGLFII